MKLTCILLCREQCSPVLARHAGLAVSNVRLHPKRALDVCHLSTDFVRARPGYLSIQARAE